MAAQARTSTISIREAGDEDASGILACLRAAFEEFRECYTPAAFLDTVLTLETLQERFERMTVLVAVNRASQIVGTVACGIVGLEEGHLRGMAVLPWMRGSGVAAQLLSSAETELRLRGCMRVTLDTTEPLQRAMHFYEKHGYLRSGKVSEFFGMPLFEYHKRLSPRENSNR